MNNKFFALALAALVCFLPHAALAAFPSPITQLVPNAQKVGEGRLSVLFWDVYDAALYAPQGKWSRNKPFALRLRYFRNIKGKDIADRSVQEMRGQGFNDEVALAAWHTKMKAIFPDVKNSTILSAVFIPGKHTKFFANNRPIGSIKGNGFIRWFSGIWLSEKTSDPELRKKLLGSS